MKYYRRTIVYTKCPLEGAFQYRDKFIIQPITRANRPHCPYAKHYPIYLDYCLEAEEGLSEFVLIERDIDNSRKICSILTALSNFEFFTYYSSSFWGVEAPSVSFDEMTQGDKEVANEAAKTSKWILGIGYTYPEIAKDRIIQSLSFPEGTAEVEMDANPYYFTDNPIQEEKEHISFHEKIAEALDTFYALDDRKRENVYSAIVLVADGIRLGLQYQSVGFVCFISSIETMMDLEFRGFKIMHCKECGQPVFSVSRKFLAYLSKYVSNTKKSTQKFKRLYTLRSKIAHSGKLFLSDREFSLLNRDTSDAEWFTYLETQQLARLSLFRWLLLNGIEENA